MDDTYLVEIRCARTRWRIKETIRAIAENTGAERYQERHPHITLYGPFTLEIPGQEKHLLDVIESVARTFDPIPFTLDGWESREGLHGGVVAFSVVPSPSLVVLTSTLARVLSGFTVSLNTWDQHPDEKWFHVTIANRLPPNKAEEIISCLVAETKCTAVTGIPAHRIGFFSLHTRLFELARKSGFLRRHYNPQIRPVLLDDTGLRITVMHNDEILGEYDLLYKCWLTKDEIHESQSWQQSLALYRKSAGFELSGPGIHGTDETFLISDLHLGHANIIHYCSRPFVHSDVAEMDRVLIANWNHCIAPDDRVYFLGDLRYSKEARPDSEYRALLNGNITFISGNHDTQSLAGMVPAAEITCEGIRFHLVHDPADAPDNFSGWIIHGHHHNNNLREFPFVDVEKRQVNVSAEVIGYYPVTLHEICRTIRELSSGSEKIRLLRYPYQSLPANH